MRMSFTSLPPRESAGLGLHAKYGMGELMISIEVPCEGGINSRCSNSAPDSMQDMHGERIAGRQFFKSPTFTKQATEHDAWEAVDDLKRLLALDPTAGDVIKGTQGLRKVRIPLAGRGARGGGRVIYFQVVAPATVLLLALYAKNEQADLDDDDKKALGALRRKLCQYLNLPM